MHPTKTCLEFCDIDMCPDGQEICPETYGPDGCRNAPVCMPIGQCPESTFDTLGCPIIKPAECDVTKEYEAYGGTDANVSYYTNTHVLH